jgi:hypothetical protein
MNVTFVPGFLVLFMICTVSQNKVYQKIEDFLSESQCGNLGQTYTHSCYSLLIVSINVGFLTLRSCVFSVCY